jgi:hypothetical protein
MLDLAPHTVGVPARERTPAVAERLSCARAAATGGVPQQPQPPAAQQPQATSRRGRRAYRSTARSSGPPRPPGADVRRRGHDEHRACRAGLHTPGRAGAIDTEGEVASAAEDDKLGLCAAGPRGDAVRGIAGEQHRNAARAFLEGGVESGSSRRRVSGIAGAIRATRWSVAAVTCTRMSSASWPAAMCAATWVASRAASERSLASRTRGGTVESFSRRPLRGLCRMG